MSGPERDAHEGSDVATGQSSMRTPPAGASTGELVSRLSEEMTGLVRAELELARAELARKGKRAGVGVGAFGAAGVVALYGAAVLVATVVLALSLVIDAWLAALIVGVVLLAVAAGMAMVGKKQVDQATPLIPERTTQNLKRDVDAVKRHDQTARTGGNGDGSLP